MKKAILAQKVGMTQIFSDNGVLVPVTVLQAGPCVVTQVKTAENERDTLQKQVLLQRDFLKSSGLKTQLSIL